MMTLTLELPKTMEEALANEARRRGTTPEQVAADDLRKQAEIRNAADGGADQQYAADQQRRHDIFAGILAEAQALTPVAPPESRVYGDPSYANAIAEKHRRQGLHL